MNPFGCESIGRTSLRVTHLGLGSGPLGGWPSPVSEAEGLATIEAAYEEGVRYFDTAPLYGYGRSEEWLGRALRAHHRDEYVVSTKVGRLLAEGAEANAFFHSTGTSLHPIWDFSYSGAKDSLEASLRRMGTDRVDIALLHDADKHLEQAVSGAYRALAELRAAGTIGAVGAGMNRSAPLTYLLQRADLDCVLIAGRYTLLDQDAIHELLPLAARKRTSVIVGGVYNSGILADPRLGATYDYAPARADQIARARELTEVCESHGIPLKAAALQFPFTHPSVAAIVVGARSVAEVRENATLLRLEIPGSFWRELRERQLIHPDTPLVPHA